jgi:tight adherence protein B
VTRGLLVAGLVALVAGVSSPARAADGARLAEAAGSHFPDRAYALTLPRAQTLTTENVEVREDGRVVGRVAVDAAEGARAHGFGVVLAIDRSKSMSGGPLRGALEAARAFVVHRSPSQPVALIFFGSDVEVALPFTTDPRAIDAALSTVADTSSGTRLLDATVRAVELLKASRMTFGSVVVLSDGADYNSVSTPEQVTAIARSAGARVFGIGLSSGRNNFPTLNVLAAGTKGEFSSATSIADLARVFEHLGSRLAHQYVIRYRSAAGPGRRVHVDVRVDGLPGVARAVYLTPKLSASHRPPFHHSPAETLWLSSAVALALCVLVGALLMLGMWMLLRPKGLSLRDRMASYVAPPAAGPDDAEPPAMLTGRLRFGLKRSLDKGRRGTAFKERLDVARITVPAERLLAWILLATVALLALLYTVGSPVLALLALGVPLGAHLYVERCVRKQRALFTEQLPDNLQMIASAMRAGHSFAAALAVVVEDAAEPTATELRRVIADERLGVPLDTALDVVVRRMQSKEFEQVALVAALQRETGGNTAEVLERVTDTVRERLGLRRMVNTLTAQGRMSRWVLTAIPVGLLAAMSLINFDYVRPLYVQPLGQAALGLAAVMVVVGSLVIKKIVNIKV